MVAREYVDDLERLATHFGGAISHDALRQALAYAARFPDEIDDWIAGQTGEATPNRERVRLARPPFPYTTHKRWPHGAWGQGQL